MTAPVAESRPSTATWQCDRHRAALLEALADWHALPTPDSDDLERESAPRRLTDQIIHRFMKLQDAMGERPVPATLEWLREPCESWPIRDRPDRLEEIGFLDAEAWAQWRDVGNRLPHEYPGAAHLRYAAIQTADAMIQALNRRKAKLPA